MRSRLRLCALLAALSMLVAALAAAPAHAAPEHAAPAHATGVEADRPAVHDGPVGLDDLAEQVHPGRAERRAPERPDPAPDAVPLEEG